MISASLPCKCERRSCNCSGSQRSGASMRPGLTHGLHGHRGMTGYMLRPTPNPDRSGRDGTAEHAFQRYKGLARSDADDDYGFFIRRLSLKTVVVVVLACFLWIVPGDLVITPIRRPDNPVDQGPEEAVSNVDEFRRRPKMTSCCASVHTLPRACPPACPPDLPRGMAGYPQACPATETGPSWTALTGATAPAAG